MKNLKSLLSVFILSTVFSLTLTAQNGNQQLLPEEDVTVTYNLYTEYEKMYVIGYKDGYCYNDPDCIEPVDPIPPNPKPGLGTARDGYVRGVKDGIKKRQSEDRQ